MILKRIKLKNIRSYENEEVIFPEGSLLVSGDIGSGKTSLLLAIEYALFGLQPGQKGSSLLRNNSSIGEVELELEVGGRTALIERRLKRTPKGVSNEYAAITIDGERSESSITEIKSKIVELLGYPKEFVKKNNILYRYTVYSPQEQMKQIILEDPDSRINILRYIFGMEKYRRIKSNLSILITDLKIKSRVLQGEIRSLDKEREEIGLRKTSYNYVKKRISEKSIEFEQRSNIKKSLFSEVEELKEMLKENDLFEREIEKTKILIGTKKELQSSIIRECILLQRALDEEKNPFDLNYYEKLTEAIYARKSALEGLNSKLLDVSGNINYLEKDKDSINEKKERIFRIDICPTCLQDVSETHKHNIMNETESKLSKIKNKYLEMKTREEILVGDIENMNGSLHEMEREKINLEIAKSRIKEIAKSREKLEDLEKQKSTLEKDIRLLINHVDELKEKILKNAPLQSKLKRKNEELQKAALSEKNSEIEIAELRRELELSMQEINRMEKSILEKEQTKRGLQETELLISWLSTSFLNLIETIERSVLLKLRKEFSQLFRKWFLMLISDNSLDSHIDENFTPVIIQGETEMDYAFLSGGERTAVALAYRLALNQTINSFLSKINTQDIIILDEPTDGFSEAQIAKIREILDELNTKQLIIVSHEQKIEGFVDNILKVTKEGNSSSIQTTSQEIYQKT